jgi:hypothetical protein
MAQDKGHQRMGEAYWPYFAAISGKEIAYYCDVLVEKGNRFNTT